MPEHPASERVVSPSVASVTFLILALGVTLLSTAIVALVPETTAQFMWADWQGVADPSGLFAKWSAMLFYPFTILRLVSPAEAPWFYFDLFHCAVAASGIYLAALRWSGSGWPAFCASVLVFPCATLGLTSASAMAALAWTPWLLLLAESAFANGERDLVLCGALAAIQLLTGSIEVVVITWVCAGICAGSVFIRNSLTTWLRFKRLGAMALLAFLLAATQLVPLMDVQPSFERNPSGSDVDIKQEESSTLAKDEQLLPFFTF